MTRLPHETADSGSYPRCQGFVMVRLMSERPIAALQSMPYPFVKSFRFSQEPVLL